MTDSSPVSPDRMADSLVADFDFFDSWEEKYGYLIELGQAIPPMDASLKTGSNRVAGCMSQVWLRLDRGSRGLEMQADSDALIVRGLIALVRKVVVGASAAEVAAFDFEDFFDRLGLAGQLSPNRRSGLAALVAKVKAFAAVL